MARILVVDDEPDVRFMERFFLERAGHDVTEAANGAAALKSVRELPPDLVVTDMMMPVINGAELMARLRADPSTAGIPILALTGDPSMAGAADAVLIKGGRPEEIALAAASLLRIGV